MEGEREGQTEVDGGGKGQTRGERGRNHNATGVL